MIKGRLGARAVNRTIEVFFMQRESPDGGANHPVTVYRRQADDINFSSGLCGDMPGNWVEYINKQKKKIFYLKRLFLMNLRSL